MTTVETEADTFFLGLTMAGAISAGAYTAGVLDVLFDALDHHNARYEARKRAEAAAQAEGTVLDAAFEDHPRHKVALRVISGTSAGGVSAGLSVAGLIAAHRGAGEGDGTGLQIGAKGDGSFTSASGYSYSYQYTLEPLHYVWIEALDLWREGPNGPEGFLTNADLGEGPVRSALNSDHINTAADTALENITWDGAPYGFLARDLDLFLTTTNLQGVPYEVGFGGVKQADAKQSHGMAQHSTVRHFRISGLGVAAHHSPWLEAWGDDGIPLDLPEVGGQINFDATAGTEWPHFKTAAIATGAFPVGLAPRVIDAEAQDFGVTSVDGAGVARGGAWPIDLNPILCGPEGDVDLRPRPMLGDQHGAAPVTYVAVDGGVANNEPFELARYTLRRRIGTARMCSLPGEPFLERNPRSADAAHSAVLMVDPFPEGPVYAPLSEEEATALSGIIPTASKLVPALINQARFKPSELIEASNRDIHSRYLISPSRRETDAEKAARGDDPEPARTGLSGAQAIASGCFGGFGGFFDRAFRAHDYMLGRRNMHSFLASHFNLAASNPVLQLGGDAGTMVPVINAGDFYATRPPLPAWPRIAQKYLEPILDNAQIRIRDVGAMLVGFTGLDLVRKFILGRVWSGLGPVTGGIETSISRALRSRVMSELIARDQHHDFHARADGKAYAGWQRDVLVALAKSGHQPVSVDDLLAVLDLSGVGEEGVEHKRDTLLRPFLADMEEAGHLWRAPRTSRMDERYTLAVLKPGKVWIDGTKAFFSRLSERVFG